MRQTSGGRLRGLKIAVTSPPFNWFGGVDRKFAADMARELREMGADLVEIDVARLVEDDAGYADEIVEHLRRFQPDVALATPNAGYALVCNLPDGRNLFRDVLEIPALLVWDHGALQFSGLLLDSPESPEDSRDGSIERMRQSLDHPLFIHYSPDRGHAQAARELGIVVDQPVHPFVHVAFPPYTRPMEELARRANGLARPAERVAFAGNVYLERVRNLNFRENEVLGRIEAEMLSAKLAQPEASLWDLLLQEIGRLDGATRRELRLTPAHSFFWRFLREEIIAVGTTHVRLQMLTSVRREIECYGNFVEPEARAALTRHYGLRFKMRDCVTELPLLYRNSAIIVEAIHPAYISGTSPKITSCFAAGGLALFDYREDFRGAVGDIADQVMFRDTDQLNELIERYLSDPRKRREVAREVQERVLNEFTFAHLASRMLVDQPMWRATRAARA